MREIMVLRHGKSDWQAPFGDDHERPLAPRGEEAAIQVGRFLQRMDKAPDLVLSSTAVRALTTARLAAEAGSWTCPIKEEPALYGASTESVMGLLQSIDKRIQRVLLAGHEPTSSAVVRHLTGSAVKFPTAALARILLSPDSWPRLQAGDGTLAWLITPKLLAATGP